MAVGAEVESILAFDEGSVGTKAVLIDQVDGVYRLVGRSSGLTSLGFSASDGLGGFRDAVRALEETTERILLTKQGRVIIPEQENGYGVDALVGSVSVMPPLRVVIAGLIRDLSVESARQAVESGYAKVQDIIALNEGGQRWGAARGIDAKLEALCQDPPDVIVLVGGFDGGASSPLLDICQMLAAVASVLESPRRPTVIFAGNREARSAVAGLLADRYLFRTTDNVRPRLDVQVFGGVQQEIEQVYRETALKRLPHLNTLAAWSSGPLVSSAKAFGLVPQFIARHYGLTRGVLAVDVGASHTQVAASLGDSYFAVVKSDLGVGAGLSKLLDEVPGEQLVRWLPLEMSPAEACNRLLGKAIRPLSLPQTREDLLLEQAAAREVISAALQDIRRHWAATVPGNDGLLPPFDLIIGSGGVLTCAPNPGQAALILLDALQPVGLTRLVLDQSGGLPAIGALAALQPLAAAQVLDQDGFLELGAVVAPLGSARPGEIALRFDMEYADGSNIRVEVAYGSLEVIPLPPEQTAKLKLRPSRRFDLGWGRPGKGGTIEVKGGVVGVIVDARGRPLPQIPQLEAQQKKMQEWLWSVGG